MNDEKKFTREYLANPLFSNLPMSYDVFLPETAVLEQGEKPVELQTGVVLDENGNASFRLYAPGTREITMEIVINRSKTYQYTFNKNGDFFEFLLENDGRFNGPLDVLLYFDGVQLLYPRLPVCWSRGAACNYVEFPTHKLDFCLVQDVPRGTISDIVYYSNELGRYVRALVYTPPGYENGTETYPVLYLQHGGGENETVWESTGKLSTIMDNAIAQKRCVPFIVVMNNGMVRYPGDTLGLRDKAFEDNLLGSCIPYIEKRFRVKTDKYSRAIAGLSMGSFLANDVAFGHPDLFGYVGAFTGCMYHGGDVQATYPLPWKKVLVEEGGETIRKGFRVVFQSATTIEDYIDYVKIDDQIFHKYGVADLPGYRFVIHDENETKWTSWRMGLNEFITLLFRAPEAYESREALESACFRA